MDTSPQGDDFETRAALYALGALPANERHAFEQELANAPNDARTAAQEFSEAAAQLNFAAHEATPAPNIRAQLLANIAQEKRLAQLPRYEPIIENYLDIRAEAGEWHNLYDGVVMKTLFVEPTNGYVTNLLKLQPGARLPNHQHKGVEQCLIIAGDFVINGINYGPGDFTVAMRGSDHRELFSPNGATLLLISPPDYEVLHR